MFTGIIETAGLITKIGTKGNYKLLSIRPEVAFDNMEVGESIAVDGCCLTVTQYNRGGFIAEVSQESMELTIIKNYKSGTEVNLERALLPTSRLGGHFVTGHIDCVGSISGLRKIGESLEITVKFPDRFAPYLVSKGSITINGISLTVNEIDKCSLKVNIIPHTLEATTVKGFKKGVVVNLEFDIIGKYIIRQISGRTEDKLTINKLIESGW